MRSYEDSVRSYGGSFVCVLMGFVLSSYEVNVR